MSGFLQVNNYSGWLNIGGLCTENNSGKLQMDN